MIPINNLSALEEAQPESVTAPSQESSDNIASIIQAFDGIENAPKDYELEEWKEMYGNYYISSINEDDDLYIWRTLKRIEYKQLVKSGMAKNQLAYEEAVISRCCLWPKMSIDSMSKQNAGTIETLAKQILFKSGFVPDQMALSLIKII